MLRILGSPRKLCSTITRRDMLWAGGLGLAGLHLSDYLRLSAVQAGSPARGFNKAKACILLYLYGAPSQLETVRHEAGRAGGDPRRIAADPLSVCRGSTSASICRSMARDHGPRDRGAVDDASVPDPRRRLRADRRAADRRANGAEPARQPALAVHRLGR